MKIFKQKESDEDPTEGNVDFEMVDTSHLKRITTTIKTLDDAIGGGIPIGMLTVIPARPGTGKSALLEAISTRASKDGIQTYYVPYEMGASNHAKRMFKRDENFGELNETSFNTWADGHERLSFIEPAKYDIEHLLFNLNKLEVQEGSLVAIDFIQCMEGKDKSRSEVLRKISKALARFASDKSVAVVVAAQMNRDIENTMSKREIPVLSDIAESDGIGHWAALVLFPIRVSVLRGLTSPARERCRIYFPKNRNGATGSVMALWVGAKQVFLPFEETKRWD